MELKKCTVTKMLFPVEFFPNHQGRSDGKQNFSYLGSLWFNVSKRAVNGRHAHLEKRGQCQRYHAKGIRLYQPWVDDATAFAWWIITNLGFPRHDENGNRLSLDRIDNNGHYEPGNLRWATPLQQVQNRG